MGRRERRQAVYDERQGQQTAQQEGLRFHLSRFYVGEGR
jgi:hypothetical protein